MPNAEVWPANTLIAEKYPKIPANDEANDDEDALISARTRHVHQTGRWKATDPNQVLLTPHCDFHLIVAPTAWSASHYVHHENATRKPSWTATETACVIFHVHHHNTNREVTRYWLSKLFAPYMAPIGSMPAHSRKTGGRRFEASVYCKYSPWMLNGNQHLVQGQRKIKDMAKLKQLRVFCWCLPTSWDAPWDKTAKILVSWDEYSQYMEKSKMFQNTNQMANLPSKQHPMYQPLDHKKSII